MAYKKIGLVAVLDVAGFLPNVTKFVSSVDKMNKTVATATKESGALSSPLKSLGSALGFMSLTAGAIVSSQIFTNIASGIGNMAREAENAAESFQLLEQRFSTLAARDYMRGKAFEGVTVGIEESLEATKGAAKANLEWVRSMAVSTPYTVQSLTDLMAYAQAAGFSQKEVQNLAQTIGDFSAGMGLQSEHVDRIIWNFAQMMSAGRVLGRELRDLGNSMVPVDYIIGKMAKDANVTKEEMKEMLQSGAVTAREFIGEFNKMSAEEFQGAMERLSDTLSFARANLKDLIDTALGLDILKPTLDEVGSMINNLLSVAMQPAARQATAIWGISLKSTFIDIRDAIENEVLPAIKTFFEILGINTPTVEGITRKILNLGLGFKSMAKMFQLGMESINNLFASISGIFKPLQDTVNESQNWGFKLIESFAKGIVAAGRIVVKALSTIADVITYWLKPGSPPLILPDIDKWGADAMNEYLAGFTQADFSIFEDISSMLERYVKVFTDINAEESIGRILGGRGAAAEVLSEWEGIGDVPASVIEKITRAAGISNSTLTKYFQSLVKLGQVMEDTAQLSDILSFSLGKATVINMQVVTSVDDVAKAAEQYDGIAKEAVMKFVNAIKTQQSAEIRAINAQNELNRVTKYYDDILGDLYEQQRVLRNEIEDTGRIKDIDRALSKMILTDEERTRLELEKRGILLDREIRDTEAAKNVAVDAAQDRYNAAKEEIKIAEDVANAQKDLAKAIADATEQQVKSQVDSYKSLLDIMIKNVEIMNDLKDAAAKAGSGAAEGLADSFDIGFPEFTLDDVTSQLETSVDLLKKQLQAEWDEFVLDLRNIFSPLKDDVDELSKKIQGITVDMGDLEKAARLVGGAIAGWATVKGLTWLSTQIPVWTLAIVGFGAAIKNVAIIDIPLFLAQAKNFGIAAGLAAVGINPVTALIALIGVLVGLIIAFGPQVKVTLDQLGFIISHWWTNTVVPWWNDTVGADFAEFKSEWNADWAEFSKAVDTFSTNLKTTINTIKTNINNKWNEIKTDFEQTKKDWKGNFDNLLSHVDKFLIDMGIKLDTLESNLKDFFTVKLPRKFDEFKTSIWNSLTKFGENIIKGIIAGVENMATSLWTTLRNIVSRAISGAEQESKTHSPSIKFMEIGKNWMVGLSKGIRDNADNVYTEMNRVVQDAQFNSNIKLNPAYASSPLGMSKFYSDIERKLNSRYASMTTKDRYTGYGAQSINNSRVVNITVNPKYEQYSSPSSIYYDVSAALASSRR